MSHRCAVSFVIAALAAAPVRGAEPPPPAALQSQADFEAAFRDTSTSPFFVMFTAVDDRTGQATTGCTAAPLFLGGMSLEMWGRYDPKTTPDAAARSAAVLKAVLANKAHVFHFAKQEALDNFFPPSRRAAEACAIIAQGKRVRSADLNGQLLVGPFTVGRTSSRRRVPPWPFRWRASSPPKAGSASPSWSRPMGRSRT